MSSQFALLRSRRFFPLFTTQFLGAFNDNLFKNALVILIAYKIADKAGLDASVMVTLAAGVFILPFFLFSATAGQLADRYEKSRLIRLIKLFEIVLMAAAGLGFYLESISMLMGILFLMGAQSSFFSPLKYSILPEHLHEHELVGGNALVEAGTFLSILLGNIVGGLLILQQGGVMLVCALIVLVAATGYGTSRFIPSAGPAAPHLTVKWNVVTQTWSIIAYIRRYERVFLSILGISWFWFLGAVFLTQFPTYAKTILQANEEVVTLFLTVFSVGIALGSLLCNWLLKGQIKGNYVPFGALGMMFFTVILFFASRAASLPSEGELAGFISFLRHPPHWLILFSLLMIAVSAGLYIVPLYAMMQACSDDSHRARVVAGNNVLNSLFVALSSVVTLGLFALKFSVTEIFLLLALLNMPVAWLARKLIRDRQE